MTCSFPVSIDGGVANSKAKVPELTKSSKPFAVCWRRGSEESLRSCSAVPGAQQHSPSLGRSDRLRYPTSRCCRHPDVRGFDSCQASWVLPDAPSGARLMNHLLRSPYNSKNRELSSCTHAFEDFEIQTATVTETATARTSAITAANTPTTNNKNHMMMLTLVLMLVSRIMKLIVTKGICS